MTSQWIYAIPPGYTANIASDLSYTPLSRFTRGFNSAISLSHALMSSLRARKRRMGALAWGREGGEVIGVMVMTMR